MMFSGTLADKKVKVLSGGERSRVLLGKMLATPSNILLLDEPTNHLDMYSIDSLCKEIKEYKGAMLVVTHDEGLLRSFANKFVVFREGRVEIFNGDYDDFLKEVGWGDEEIKRIEKKSMSGKKLTKK